MTGFCIAREWEEQSSDEPGRYLAGDRSTSGRAEPPVEGRWNGWYSRSSSLVGPLIRWRTLGIGHRSAQRRGTHNGGARRVLKLSTSVCLVGIAVLRTAGDRWRAGYCAYSARLLGLPLNGRHAKAQRASRDKSRGGCHTVTLVDEHVEP